MDINPKEIGNRIKECRKRAGLTQEQLSERIGLSKNHISGIERGLNQPTIGFLLSLYLSIGCSPNEILLGIPTQEVDEITSKIQRLSAKDQEFIANIIDLILHKEH